MARSEDLIHSFARIVKNERGSKWEMNCNLQGPKLTFLARSHLAPKFFKVVAKAKKLGSIKKKDS